MKKEAILIVGVVSLLGMNAWAAKPKGGLPPKGKPTQVQAPDPGPSTNVCDQAQAPENCEAQDASQVQTGEQTGQNQAQSQPAQTQQPSETQYYQPEGREAEIYQQQNADTEQTPSVSKRQRHGRRQVPTPIPAPQQAQQQEQDQEEVQQVAGQDYQVTISVDNPTGAPATIYVQHADDGSGEVLSEAQTPFKMSFSQAEVCRDGIQIQASSVPVSDQPSRWYGCTVGSLSLSSLPIRLNNIPISMSNGGEPSRSMCLARSLLITPEQLGCPTPSK